MEARLLPVKVEVDDAYAEVDGSRRNQMEEVDVRWIKMEINGSMHGSR